MAQKSIRRLGQQVYRLLQQSSTAAADDFVRLCALCALDAQGWLPCPGDPCWQGLWQGEDFDRHSGAALAHLRRALPTIFSDEKGLQSRWFAPNGAAQMLRPIYTQQPPESRCGLTARLWEGCAELPRRQSFAELRQNRHHTGKNAAYATQLFTPDWLACFLTENSLGRLVGQTQTFAYYMGEAPCNITADPATITLLDPCAGGGDLLCRSFDLLHPLLTQRGMSPGQAAQHLLEHTLCGLDLDPGALKVCYLELMLRGRRAAPEFFTLGVSPRLAAVEYADGSFCPFGSLLGPNTEGFDRLNRQAKQLLEGQYDLVITNPPYMGRRGMTTQLRAFLRQHFPEGTGDLYAAFVLRCLQLTKPQGYTALLVPQGWLTLASFADLRSRCAPYHMPVLLQLGAHAFPDIAGEVVQTAAFVLCKQTAQQPTCLCDLSRFADSNAKQQAFLLGKNRCTLPSPLGQQPLPPNCRPLGEQARICQGLATGDNHRFVRLWYEVDPSDISRSCTSRAQAAASGKVWFPYNKGGGFRRWWGNDLYVVNFAQDGRAIRRQTAPNGRPRARVQNANYYFRAGVTYSFVGSKNFSARVTPPGAIFDVGGSTAFPQPGEEPVTAALLNSASARRWLTRRNPTVNFQVGDLAALPCPDLKEHKSKVEALALTCIDLARRHWEETEPAPAFFLHPWAEGGHSSLEQAAQNWLDRRTQEEARLQAAQLRLDQIFADLYGDEKPISPQPAQFPDLAEECRRFLSWCVGRIVGRFGNGTPLALVPLWEDAQNSLAQRVTALFADLWGEDGRAEALTFLAEQLGWQGDPYAALGQYFRGNFFTHHNKLYQNRPVYWLCPHQRFPTLLYYHNLTPGTAKALAKLWGQKGSFQLRQAEKLWKNLDKNLGIAHHILAAAELGLAKLPPALERKQKEKTI